MIIEIKVPSPGESITEVEIANWQVTNGDYVEKDQDIVEIESDKATLSISAEEAGTINLLANEGDTVKIGSIICTIDTSTKTTVNKTQEMQNQQIKNSQLDSFIQTETENKQVEEIPKPDQSARSPIPEKIKISPLAKKTMQENQLSIEDVLSGLRRISKKDIEAVLDKILNPKTPKDKPASREEKRQKISSLRKKLSERLVSVKNETAMLTTFNEVDMTEVIKLKNQYKSEFLEKHQVKLGFMSFFTKAVCKALEAHPMVNAFINGEEIVLPDYKDIGIAVQSPKGLMVPVLRNVETKNLAEIEIEIANIADKARKGKISIEEMSGGTFTITNGGVFGSMLSTPILNPPQSGILGMHNILERPVAINGKVEIRPMMYIALSYDHRVIDGKDSVGFLVKVKEFIESPILLLAKNDLKSDLFDL